jgi:outer membrane protein assembly factor BamA
MHASPRRLVGPLVRACAIVALAALPLAAQRNSCNRFRPLIDEVKLTGAKRVSGGHLNELLLVQKTDIWYRRFGWHFSWSTGAVCLDSADIATDVGTILNEYTQRGFLAARVTGTVQRHGDRRARVLYNILEGEPVTVSSVTITGLPKAAADSAALVRYLVGQPFDDSLINAVADSIRSRIRDAGYARVDERLVQATIDSAGRTGTIQLSFVPGVLTYVDSVTVRFPADSSPTLRAEAVRTTFGVRKRDQYSARSIAAGTRELSALELYRQIRIDTAPPRSAGGTRDSIGLVVTLVEQDRYRARTTAGWGTLDCFRTQTKFSNQDFLGFGHRLELTGRVSKIGVAEPTGGLKSFCAGDVSDDPFSQNLNYYAGATVRLRGLPTIGTARWQPDVTVFSERRSEVGAYEQTTEIGTVLSSTHRLGPRLTLTGQLTYTDSHTSADRAVSCETFGFCRLEDVSTFVLRTPQQSVSGALASNPLLPSDDPVSGSRWSTNVKYGHANVGKLLPIDFGRFVLEGTRYVPVGDRFTFAVRGQIGGVVTSTDGATFLPPAERFYGGGQNTVRGFAQNRLGPGSYIVTQIDTVTSGGMQVGVANGGYDHPAPSGGNAMWLANLELRTRFGWPIEALRWVGFVDVGRVWNTRDVFSVTNADARATPGFGLRLLIPGIGPFRFDVGYNPNGVEPGPAFLIIKGDPAKGTNGRAVCVSPGSDDPLTLGPGATPSSNSCPATYVPPPGASIWSRFALHFSLGHAF